MLRQHPHHRTAADTDWAAAYTSSRTYDLAGNVKSQTYPSGKVVNYSYNTASQMSSFTGNLGDGVSRNYATGLVYNPRGQMMRETFGTTTNLYHRRYYNRRGQMFDSRLGTDGNAAYDVENPVAWRWAAGTWNRGAIRLYYSSTLNDYDDYTTSGGALVNNNGNVQRMEHFVPGNDSVTTYSLSIDKYNYDALNRLLDSKEYKQTESIGETDLNLKQFYLYDRFGNRRVDNANSNFPGVFNAAFNVDQTNNRLLAPNGTISYDAVGNQTNDGYSGAGSRTYDANNKLVSATTSSGTASYKYNANGSRVSKTVGSVTTWHIYGLDGELVAEYPANGATSTPQFEYGYRNGELLIEGGCDAVRWRVTDHLGSTRMSVGATGTLASVRRTDYLPFGEELGAGVGARTTGQGYSQTDCWRQKFTGYERDSESGLDFAEARYFSSTQGRFTSTDPLMASGRVWNPQSWNRYSYVLNRPLSLIDPNGLEDEDPNDPQSGRKKKEEEATIQIKTADTPKILGVKVKLIDPVKGEVPIGGEFEVTYKYAINDPSTVQDAQKPGDYGSIQPITPTGTFTDVNNVGLVGDPKVVVNQKKETVEVEKTERYVVKGTACGGDSCAINFKVVVKDPVNTDKTVTVRSVNQPTFFDKSPQYIPVRNIPKSEKRK